MSIINISNNISYISPSTEPLSCNVGLVVTGNTTWIYDVGNNSEALEYINSIAGNKNIIISHFHPDHMGNLDKISFDNLYVGDNTYKYTKTGTVVSDALSFDEGSLNIFALPSSHSKGCLGFEVNEEYAFLGDATYPAYKEDASFYNVQKLHDQIEILKALKAKYFLLSHRERYVMRREVVLRELEYFYSKRDKNDPFIRLK